MLAEAILLRKVNSSDWDCTLLAMVMKKSRSDRVEARLAAELRMEAEMNILPTEKYHYEVPFLIAGAMK